MLLWALSASAVQLNPEGEGEVLLFPFYSVNNNLNTAYSVVNASDQAKALKITFREAEVGLAVLSFNVYLGPFDVWTGVLGGIDSSQTDHQGEPSVVHVSADASCVAGIEKSGTEFNARALDEEFFPSNRSLERSRTGFFEVLELGVLNGLAAAHVNHNPEGVPDNCAAIEAAWADDQWDLEALSPPTGRLSGTAFFVNVAEGLAMPYDAVALNNFWAAEGLHSAPGSALPDLSSGSTQSRVLLDDGQLAVSDWQTGFEAVSAVLMHAEVFNEYGLDTDINGKSEWVLTFPTKHHHVLREPHRVKAPFAQYWNGLYSCDEYALSIYDRESQVPRSGPGTVVSRTNPELCQAANVIEYLLAGATPTDTSPILGHPNHTRITSPSMTHATENGWVQVSFPFSEVMRPESGAGFAGMPVTGFMVQQFTNAIAAEGLLAQYGNTFSHKGRVSTSPAN